jgi:tetratricopeptide (TPR) repeat protein
MGSPYWDAQVLLIGGLFIAIFVNVYKEKEEYEHFSRFELMLFAALFIASCVSLYYLIQYWKHPITESTVTETPAPVAVEDDPYVDLVDQGNGYLGDGNLSDATKSLDAAIALNPDRPEAYTSMSVIANSAGNSKEEMRLLNLAISKGSYGYAYEFRAHAYNEQKKYKLALADATKAIESGNFTFRVYDYRAVDYLNPDGDITQDDYVHALDDSQEAIKLEPDDSQAFVIEGVALYGLGVCQDAIDAYNEALDISNGGEFEADMRNAFWDNFDARNCVDDPRDSGQDQSVPATTTPGSDLESGEGV